MSRGRFAGERALVVGLGSSGMSAATALLDEGASVAVSESRPLEAVDSEAAILERRGAVVWTGGHAPWHLADATLVVTSPGVPESASILRLALDRELRVWSELELGARLCTVPFVAVTGTNGKSTTTEMIAAAMRRAGLDAVACGNVGHPFSAAAGEGRGALAVEASSFQLRFTESFHPRVSVLTNLAPDHLDWHGTLDGYRRAKARIFENQGRGDVHVGNRDDPAARKISSQARCWTRWFTAATPRPEEAGFREGRLVVRLEREDGPIDLGHMPVTSTAHRMDAAAAALAAVSFGLDPEAVREALHEFPALPHRGAVVAEAGGVPFVDDSKATNPHAALAAVAGQTNVVLVAGGRSKGIDLSPLAAAAPSLMGVVAIGEAAAEIAALFRDLVPVRLSPTIEDAVTAAYELAAGRGKVVLAPACASQDMFRDYRERGDRFAAAARALAASIERRRAHA